MLDVLATHQKSRCPAAVLISCSGPACAKTRPVRALYNPDGRHTYVGRFVRTFCDFVVWKLLCRDPLMASRCLCL